VIVSRQPRLAMPFRHHDEKTVTASPLESAVTNRDARNPFTIRFLAPREVEGYEHRQMASPSPFNFASLLTLPRKKRVCKSLVLNSLRTLPSSVSRKAFICHPYENCRVYTNNSHSRTRHSPLLTPHNTQVLSFHILANSFALAQDSTLLFSSNSELFAQNTRGWGTPSQTLQVPLPLEPAGSRHASLSTFKSRLSTSCGPALRCYHARRRPLRIPQSSCSLYWMKPTRKRSGMD